MDRFPDWKKALILDTNMLLAPAQFNVDVYAQSRELLPGKELCTVDKCLEELGKISKEKGMAKKAKTALEAMEKNRLRVARIGSKKDTDSVLIELAREGAVIATNDSELRKKLQKQHSSHVFLKQKKMLSYSGS
ncbi:MAG TPA: hypothetical protein VJI67_03760 [archaeon]|nr:hypothetical protein [archaeon]HLD80679.1 hypothetical protein [archaeon]